MTSNDGEQDEDTSSTREEADGIELSVIVTAHAEGRLLHPTMASVAKELARAEILPRSEVIVVCDNADEPTRANAEEFRRAHAADVAVRVLVTEHGDPGASRNEGVRAARGRYVAIVDGDDVVVGGFFATGMQMLRDAERPSVVHPHLILSFGARRATWVLKPTTDRRTTHLDLIRFNQWPSTAIAERALYERLPYPSLPSARGYGPEDWMWNLTTVLRGIEHVVADGSVLCYRVRHSGGINNGHRTSMLPAVDLATLREALPLPVRSEQAPTPLRDAARRVVRAVYGIARPVARAATRNLTYEQKREIYVGMQRRFRRMIGSPEPDRPLFERSDVEEALRDATFIDPAISWAADQVSWLPEWSSEDDGYGRVLYDACDALEGIEAIVAVPWVGVGGADIVSLNYARALQQSDRFRGKVAILATHLEERTRRDMLPPDIPFVQLPASWLDLPTTERRRLLSQLVVQVRPELVVSVNCFHMTEALEDFYRPMTDGTAFFLTLFAFDRVGRLRAPVSPITDDGQRQYLDRIKGVITDNKRMATVLADVLGLGEEVVRVHRQPALVPSPPLDRATVAYEEANPHPIRLLWPHRLDREKRPDTLIAVARRLIDLGVAAEIDVYGQRVLAGAGRKIESELRAVGIRYRGPYAGGLSSLPTQDYHAMLLTSEYEGLPLVLVQAHLLGLPTIATDVGGVSDIVQDGRTGLLTQGPDDVEGFVTAIRRLAGDRELRRTLIEQAHAFAVEKHSWEAFERTVAEDVIGRGRA